MLNNKDLKTIINKGEKGEQDQDVETNEEKDLDVEIKEEKRKLLIQYLKHKNESNSLNKIDHVLFEHLDNEFKQKIQQDMKKQ